MTGNGMKMVPSTSRSPSSAPAETVEEEEGLGLEVSPSDAPSISSTKEDRSESLESPPSKGSESESEEDTATAKGNIGTPEEGWRTRSIPAGWRWDAPGLSSVEGV